MLYLKQILYNYNCCHNILSSSKQLLLYELTIFSLLLTINYIKVKKKMWHKIYVHKFSLFEKMMLAWMHSLFLSLTPQAHESSLLYTFPLKYSLEKN